MGSERSGDPRPIAIDIVGKYFLTPFRKRLSLFLKGVRDREKLPAEITPIEGLHKAYRLVLPP